VATPKKRYE